MLRSIATNAIGKSAVFCLMGADETKFQIEASVVKKMKSQGFDAAEGRHVIPLSDLYSAKDLATLLYGAGFHSITEITYGNAVTSTAPDLVFYWFSESGEKQYPTTRMGLDPAIRALIDSLGSNQKRD